jgi:hypothetical protein
MHIKFWLGSLKGRDHPENLGVDGRTNIKIVVKEIVCEDVDWIHLAQDWVRCRAIVNTVMNLRVP